MARYMSWNRMNVLRNAVHQQTSHAVVPVINCDGMTCFVELVCASKASRTGSDDGDFVACPMFRRVWSHPSHFEALTNSCT